MTAAEVPPLDASQRAAVRDVAVSVGRRDGSPPLSDAALGLLGSPAARHWREGTSYAQLHDGSLEIVAAGAPDVAALLDAVEAAVDAPFQVWSHGTASVVAPELERRGYRRGRVLHQLRRDLADLPPPRRLPEEVAIRPFRPGTDEDSWLAVNAAAFATHPEQGRWTRADIAEREDEPWFRTEDFLLAWQGETLRGFHWTKVHEDGCGEVYILGVDPSAQGTGLGGALLDAGLHHLARRGCTAVLLYVDDDNRAAMRLYERSGFARADVDVQWRTG